MWIHWEKPPAMYLWMFKKDIAFIALKSYVIQINEQGFTLMCKQLSVGRIERKTLRLTKMSFLSKCTVQITSHFIQNHLHMIFISLKIAMIQHVNAIISKPSINLHGLNINKNLTIHLFCWTKWYQIQTAVFVDIKVKT